LILNRRVIFFLSRCCTLLLRSSLILSNLFKPIYIDKCSLTKHKELWDIQHRINEHIEIIIESVKSSYRDTSLCHHQSAHEHKSNLCHIVDILIDEVHNCLQLYDSHLRIESLFKSILEETCVFFFTCKGLYYTYSRKTHFKLVVYLRYGLLIFIHTIIDRRLCPAKHKKHYRQGSKRCESESPIETEHCNDAKCDLACRLDGSKNAGT